MNHAVRICARPFVATLTRRHTTKRAPGPAVTLTMKTAMTLALMLLLTALSTPAPAAGLTLATLDGEPTDLGALISKDKWTLVMVWTTYCGVCREQYPRISAFHRKHEAQDAVVRGISLDGLDKGEKVARYREEKEHAFPSVLSEATSFRENYERWTEEDFTGTPTYLLFDPQRRLRAYLDGPITMDKIEAFIAQK